MQTKILDCQDFFIGPAYRCWYQYCSWTLDVPVGMMCTNYNAFPSFAGNVGPSNGHHDASAPGARSTGMQLQHAQRLLSDRKASPEGMAQATSPSVTSPSAPTHASGPIPSIAASPTLPHQRACVRFQRGEQHQ